MKSSARLSLRLDARRTNLPLAAVMLIVMSVVLGMLLTDSMEEMVGYVLVTLACAMPVGLWIWAGSTSIPVLPAVSAMFFIYYALPIVRGSASELGFGPSEILTAAATVTLFLVVATLSWWLLLAGFARRSRGAAQEVISGPQVHHFMFVGLTLGVLYHVAFYTGWLDWLGPNFGVIRAVMLTTATVACFLLGHARARGSLGGRDWLLAVAGLSSLVLLSWSTLYLITG